eukprot:11362033-Ditylum_brightwellii.AAC.1
MCLDHIRPGRSKVSPSSNAGYGAFATKHLPKGTIVAPAPLVHIPNKDVLRMYPLILDGPNIGKKKTTAKKEERIQWQLLLNYCYGHSRSTMLLLPYSPVVNFINHSSKAPNVYIRWSATNSSSAHHKPSWLNMTIDEISTEEGTTGLVMEFVAIKDIKKGEEIMLNYGVEWEKAWKRHVEKDWEPTYGSDMYISAYEMNALQNTSFHILRTKDEGAYPFNIEIGCY